MMTAAAPSPILPEAAGSTETYATSLNGTIPVAPPRATVPTPTSMSNMDVSRGGRSSWSQPRAQETLYSGASSWTPPPRDTGFSPNSDNPYPRIEATLVKVKDGISIDSALLSAMRDPRERVALLKCEQGLLDFIKSDSTEIDIGGAGNSVIIGLGTLPARTGSGRPSSFQRCWLHRLADRFGIVRESISQEWIRCRKTPDSAVPSVLLIDLQPSDYSLQEQCPTNSTLQVSKNSDGNKPKRNRMKIMKRAASASSADSNQKSNSSKKNHDKSGSLTDLEKAYAEARARIFNDEAAADTEATSTTAAAESITALEDGIAATTITTKHLKPAQLVIREQDQERAVKATWRNRQKEENDPDFQRGYSYPAYGYYPAPTQQQQQLQHVMYHHHQQQQQQDNHYAAAAHGTAPNVEKKDYR